MRISFAPGILALVLLLGCAASRPADLGVRDGRLLPCPESPNCVSSDASDDEHAIQPFTFSGDPDEAWATITAAVRELPRTVVAHQTPGYLHAESTTAIMRYVDDLELQLRPDEGVIAVRSASRIGYSDMGANRERVESLRALVASEGGLD